MDSNEIDIPMEDDGNGADAVQFQSDKNNSNTSANVEGANPNDSSPDNGDIGGNSGEEKGLEVNNPQMNHTASSQD